MKKFLTLTVAGSALLAAGCTTAAMANDGHQMHSDVHVVVDMDENTGPSVIVRGVEIEVVDGDVIINGDAVRSTSDGRVIISGDNATVIHSGRRDRDFAVWVDDGDHALRLAEIEADVERMQNVRVMFEGRHAEELEAAMENLELNIEELDGQRFVIINGERREMTDEERELVRNELEAARIEIRESMHNVERELAEAHADREAAHRVMRLELRNAEREIGEARRMLLIANQNREIGEDVLLRLRENGARRMRFVSEDGEERIWIDGEELEGEARTEWLNRMEIERLEGGGDESHRVVIEITDDEE